MEDKRIVVFHPDINVHKTNNEYTKKMYSIFADKYSVQSFEWFIKHLFGKNIECLYLNWYENTIGIKVVILQIMQYFCKYLLLVIAKRRGIKVIYAVHNKTPHAISKDSDIYQCAAKKFMQKALNIADLIVVLCEHTENYLASEFEIPNLHEKIRLVPHGKYDKYECDESVYCQKYNIDKGDLVFSFVGKMDKYKNVDIIIKGFYEADIDGKLLLVGKCDEEYRKILESLMLDERVICDFSFVSDEDMSGIMQMASAIVLPYENTSINSGIMMNAFSNGTTVIGTDIEMLQDYSDELVYGYTYGTEEEHVHALATQMKKAEEDYKTGMLLEKGAKLEQILEKANSWGVVKKTLFDCLDE